MATSGSVDFNQTRNEIIQDALQLLGIYGVGRTVSAEDQAFCGRALNKMIKAWQAKGIHLWAKEEGYLFPDDETGKYTLPLSGLNARTANVDNANITQLDGDHALGATTLTVDSTSGMTAATNIGIVQDDDVVHWTTIVSVDSATAVTLTTGLAGAASDNAHVYQFQLTINKPLRIHAMRRISGDGTTQNDTPLTPLSHSEYYNIASKNINGTPTSFYYNPDLTTGELHLWPRPSDPQEYFGFTYDRMLEDFDASTDNPDLPTEWLEALTYQLAVRIAPGYGKEQKVQQLILPMASVMLDDLLNWDTEVTTVTFVPDQGSY